MVNCIEITLILLAAVWPNVTNISFVKELSIIWTLKRTICTPFNIFSLLELMTQDTEAQELVSFLLIYPC